MQIEDTYKKSNIARPSHALDDGCIHRRYVDDNTGRLSVMLMLKANAVVGRRRQAGRLLMNSGVNHRLYGRNRLWLYGCHLFNVVGDEGGTAVHHNRWHL